MRKRIFKRNVYDKMLEWKRERNDSVLYRKNGKEVAEKCEIPFM